MVDETGRSSGLGLRMTGNRYGIWMYMWMMMMFPCLRDNEWVGRCRRDHINGDSLTDIREPPRLRLIGLALRTGRSTCWRLHHEKGLGGIAIRGVMERVYWAVVAVGVWRTRDVVAV